jgi:uncharacterized protein
MREQRTIASEFQVSTQDDRASVEGYAAVYDKLSEDLGGFVEKVSSSAFLKSMKEADVRALLNHDPNIILGRTKSGTLKLSSDATGLHYEIDIDLESPNGRNAYRAIECGDVSQSSFTFEKIHDEWDTTSRGYPLRTLTECRLFDVSPCVFPAYEATETNVKRALTSLAEQRSLEVDVLARAALSGNLTTYLKEPEEPLTDSTPHLELERYRLELLKDAYGY